MPTTKALMAIAFEDALDSESDTVVDPVLARMRIAVKLADAVNDFVIGRTVNVAAVQPGTGTAAGLIQ